MINLNEDFECQTNINDELKESLRLLSISENKN